MSAPTTPHLCRERAAIAGRAAREATLDNVRERHLVAERTWLEMAERGERVARMRDDLIARKAAERALAESV